MPEKRQETVARAILTYAEHDGAYTGFLMMTERRFASVSNRPIAVNSFPIRSCSDTGIVMMHEGTPDAGCA